jgi:cytochrome b561
MTNSESVIADGRVPHAVDQPSIDRYDRMTRSLHWITLIALIAVFALAWARQYVTDRQTAGQLLQLHQSFGLLVWCVTALRLSRRLFGSVQIPRLPTDMPGIQKLGACTTECLLYVLMMVQPALGLMHAFAHNRAINLFLIWRVSPLFRVDGAMAGLLRWLHAAAALYHHYVRRDDVLRSMLAKRQDPHQANRALSASATSTAL